MYFCFNHVNYIGLPIEIPNTKIKNKQLKTKNKIK